MRYLLTITLLLLFLCLLFDYIVIPNNITVVRSCITEAKKDGLFRIIIKDNKWKNSFDQNNSSSGDNKDFSYNNNLYKIDYKTVSSVIITIDENNKNIKSSLSFIPHEPDTTYLIWQASIPASYNPYRRFSTYLFSRKLGNDMNEILKRLSSQYSKMEKVYGIDVKKEEVKDSVLISASININGFPTTPLIYQQIDKLKKFVKSEHGTVTGYPMLNITTGDSINYLVRVALPVDRELTTTKDISYKRMMSKGKILKATVTGGYGSINAAFANMNNYVSDYHFISPAIPFQSLITDRSTVTDSAKWITDIYYPVM